MNGNRDSNKVKIAKRVVEIFEFFSDGNDRAIVKDIVKRYGRPQSSTSELMSSLVEMGFLYRHRRSFIPTPRMAVLGMAGQPEFLQDGRLYRFMEHLAQSSGHTVLLLGLVGTTAQVFRCVQGSSVTSPAMATGSSVNLCSSAAGLLLLASLGGDHARRVLWRLTAEAPSDGRIDQKKANEIIPLLQKQEWASGLSGFVDKLDITAVLVPQRIDAPPLAVAVMHRKMDPGFIDRLVEDLKVGIKRDTRSKDGDQARSRHSALVGSSDWREPSQGTTFTY